MMKKNFGYRNRNFPVITRQDNLIRPGDIFVTWAPHILNKAISIVQAYSSLDGKGDFGHAGFFVNSEGISFEALWNIGEKDFFVKHHGEFAIIARHDYIFRNNFIKAYNKIKEKHDGKMYPVYRLLFHISPVLSRFMPFDNGVCSEITGELLYEMEIWNWYKGAKPDHVHDWMCNQWDFNINTIVGWVNVNPYK